MPPVSGSARVKRADHERRWGAHLQTVILSPTRAGLPSQLTQTQQHDGRTDRRQRSKFSIDRPLSREGWGDSRCSVDPCGWPRHAAYLTAYHWNFNMGLMASATAINQYIDAICCCRHEPVGIPAGFTPLEWNEPAREIGIGEDWEDARIQNDTSFPFVYSSMCHPLSKHWDNSMWRLYIHDIKRYWRFGEKFVVKAIFPLMSHCAGGVVFIHRCRHSLEIKFTSPINISHSPYSQYSTPCSSQSYSWISHNFLPIATIYPICLYIVCEGDRSAVALLWKMSLWAAFLPSEVLRPGVPCVAEHPHVLNVRCPPPG